MRCNGFLPVLWHRVKKGGITMTEIVASISFGALIAAQFLAVVFAHNYRNAA
jgi:hypothetical protein